MGGEGKVRQVRGSNLGCQPVGSGRWQKEREKKKSPSLIGLLYWTSFTQAQSHRTDTDINRGDAFLKHLRTGHPVTQHFLILLTQPRTFLKCLFKMMSEIRDIFKVVLFVPFLVIRDLRIQRELFSHTLLFLAKERGL